VAETKLILPPAKNKLAEQIAAMMDRMTIALHPSVSPQQFATCLVVTVNQLDPSKVSDATSVLVSAYNCAAIGLLPGSQLGLAYFIPRKGRCNLEIGYRGFLDLAFRNDHLKSIHAECVFEGEEFDWYVDSDGPQIMHRPDPDRDPSQARTLTKQVYCVYRTKAGGRGARVMTRAQINKIDSREHVWFSDYYEMARKSAVRRAAKDWRVTLHMSQAMDLDEKAELGMVQHLLPGLKAEVVDTTFSLDDIPDEIPNVDED
jgi:recombination protein RecT